MARLLIASHYLRIPLEQEAEPFRSALDPTVRRPAFAQFGPAAFPAAARAPFPPPPPPSKNGLFSAVIF